MRRAAMAVGVAACACVTQVESPAADPVGLAAEGDSVRRGLSVDAQRARADGIKDVARARGSRNPLLFAAIAYHESGLAQCWSEATWTCQGPWSDACGGPVLAGAADGPCANEQGGLGMYQLDSGTHAQTLGAHGADVLSPEGNTRAGIDFIIHKTRICPNTPQFGGDDEVLAWLDRAVPGSAEYDAFMTAMAWCYNGCAPSYTSCNHQAVKASYRGAAEHLLSAFGTAYWFDGAGTAEPPPPPAGCGAVSYQGYCNGTTVVWCENNELRSANCDAQGHVCGWESDAVGNNCVAPPPPPGCGDVTYQGYCSGSTLTWCEQDAIRTYDCASAGMGCGWQDDATGNNCR
ncbi:MAG: hypothetical protein HY904_02770 [Deltaproteobacteria bacterium]|nr:hypothetical protein [Deltaproteobacteria bacterium]